MILDLHMGINDTRVSIAAVTVRTRHWLRNRGEEQFRSAANDVFRRVFRGGSSGWQ